MIDLGFIWCIHFHQSLHISISLLLSSKAESWGELGLRASRDSQTLPFFLCFLILFSFVFGRNRKRLWADKTKIVLIEEAGRRENKRKFLLQYFSISFLFTCKNFIKIGSGLSLCPARNEMDHFRLNMGFEVRRVLNRIIMAKMLNSPCTFLNFLDT